MSCQFQLRRMALHPRGKRRLPANHQPKRQANVVILRPRRVRILYYFLFFFWRRGEGLAVSILSTSSVLYGVSDTVHLNSLQVLT